jgi:tetratricopeptide (TPR) repeat protein
MWHEAEESFREALDNSPRMAEAYVQLGGICLQRGDLEGCLNYNRHAKDCRLQYAVPWANMGFCYIQMGKYDEAVKCLKKAINRDPDFVQAHATLGSAHIMAKDYEEGIAASRKALELAPEFGPAWNNMGLYCWRRATSEARALPGQDQRPATRCPGPAGPGGLGREAHGALRNMKAQVR